MKKIIYVMNVDWNWIKQRPHFIAEGLSQKYDVEIVYQYRYGRKKLQKRENQGLNLHPIFLIPKLSGFKHFKWINDFLFVNIVKRKIKIKNPDVVFVTYPTQVDIIPNNYDGSIVYDCMDNHSAFLNDYSYRVKIEEKENILINKSNIVFVSSQYLITELKNRYGIKDNKLVLIRNAYDGELIRFSSIQKNDEKFRMAYVGTISSWFDWDTIKEVLNKNRNIELHMYGPVENTIIPNISSIIYHGTIEHDLLYGAIQDMDTLIMPFIVNDIIKAVDPVKLYEYINFNKNIIMCYYDEVCRFEKFVYFYTSPFEFLEAIEAIQKDKSHLKYTNEQKVDFLLDNSWGTRVKHIEQFI